MSWEWGGLVVDWLHWGHPTCASSCQGLEWQLLAQSPRNPAQDFLISESGFRISVSFQLTMNHNCLWRIWEGCESSNWTNNTCLAPQMRLSFTCFKLWCVTGMSDTGVWEFCLAPCTLSPNHISWGSWSRYSTSCSSWSWPWQKYFLVKIPLVLFKWMQSPWAWVHVGITGNEPK